MNSFMTNLSGNNSKPSSVNGNHPIHSDQHAQLHSGAANISLMQNSAEIVNGTKYVPQTAFIPIRSTSINDESDILNTGSTNHARQKKVRMTATPSYVPGQHKDLHQMAQRIATASV